LFKVSKAYAVHDSEVGYCQGLSFIAASLLLHVSNIHTNFDLVAPGKLVVQKDMHLIDMANMGYVLAQGAGNEPDSVNACLNAYAIRAEWKAQEKAFEQLNLETSKTNLTVAVDIVMRGIQEPVRFVIETPVTIQSANEMRIMDHFMSKRPMTLRFYLHLKRTDELNWKVNSIDPSEEITEQASGQQGSSSLLKMGMNNLSRIVRSSSIASIEDDCPTDYSSDGDEPLPRTATPT